MEPISTVTSAAVPYFHPDVDTDRVIPHRFCRKPLSAGYRNFLLHDERMNADGSEDPKHILHQSQYRNARIMIVGPNFGCGSAREGAVYSVQDWGFRALISPSFAAVYKSNCYQNGIIPVELPEAVVEGLARQAEAQPGAVFTVDLPAQTLTAPDGKHIHFDIEPTRKEQLLEGLDDIGLTLRQSSMLDTFEQGYYERRPWLAQAAATK